MPARDVWPGTSGAGTRVPRAALAAGSVAGAWAGTLLRGSGGGEAEPPVPRCSVSWLSRVALDPVPAWIELWGRPLPKAPLLTGHEWLHRSKTCHKQEFPLLLKKVPALPGNLSWEGDVFHTGGKFFVWLRHPWELREAITPCKSRHRFAPFTPHPLAKPPPFPHVSSASKRGRKSHLMQTKVV